MPRGILINPSKRVFKAINLSDNDAGLIKDYERHLQTRALEVAYLRSYGIDLPGIILTISEASSYAWHFRKHSFVLNGKRVYGSAIIAGPDDVRGYCLADGPTVEEIMPFLKSDPLKITDLAS